ncbi:hypothetical protein BU24DRAFT_468754 [Aaosphaeria arxii CBS 175.79]|uniref:Uncharacterized protein n=1 Tax=Aaosphaeria arxii CBS 175.79 TaxID=1450172 RepID=A0A6A5X6W1_9PLEO|nr:uncharacterized protein BU24DRAFT_468754 [Aaosphaeria arxii CBS 175.79]KAF2008642.1 hypothetical protein BU24DRAFT_468754 [Aaosphaeria arxii CBS 175.79]
MREQIDSTTKEHRTWTDSVRTTQNSQASIHKQVDGIQKECEEFKKYTETAQEKHADSVTKQLDAFRSEYADSVTKQVNVFRSDYADSVTKQWDAFRSEYADLKASTRKNQDEHQHSVDGRVDALKSQNKALEESLQEMRKELTKLSNDRDSLASTTEQLQTDMQSIDAESLKSQVNTVSSNNKEFGNSLQRLRNGYAELITSHNSIVSTMQKHRQASKSPKIDEINKQIMKLHPKYEDLFESVEQLEDACRSAHEKVQTHTEQIEYLQSTLDDVTITDTSDVNQFYQLEAAINANASRMKRRVEDVDHSIKRQEQITSTFESSRLERLSRMSKRSLLRNAKRASEWVFAGGLAGFGDRDRWVQPFIRHAEIDFDTSRRDGEYSLSRILREEVGMALGDSRWTDNSDEDDTWNGSEEVDDTAESARQF